MIKLTCPIILLVLPTLRCGWMKAKVSRTQHYCEVRIGGAALLFPLDFSTLLYMVRMLFIQPASMAASNPLTAM